MRQLPERINGSSVSVAKAASVSMCACKSSTHDTHRSVFFRARCATARSVSVAKVSLEMSTRARRERERMASEAAGSLWSDEQLGCRSNPPPKVAVFCKRRFFKEEPRRRRWGVAREFEESEVDVFSGKSSETAGSQESRFRT